MLKETFLNKLKEKYPNNFNKYDYSLVPNIVNSKNNKDKNIFICLKHGEFEQNPSKHLNGRGCKKCGIIRRAIFSTLTLDEFIKKAKEVHKEKYSYQRTEYTKAKNKIIITCPT
ncbi:MAG: hypothetical protein FGM41_04295, partial [Bacteroidetes bacterium]|nr:hypothetical protein [Bacteroidota bacterium]